MTKLIPIPSREFDGKVAEKIMGWIRTFHWSAGGDGPREVLVHPTDGSVDPDDFPHYSTNISAAWEVVEKVREMSGGYFTLMAFGDVWRADAFFGVAEAPTAPLAICLAALRYQKGKE